MSWAVKNCRKCPFLFIEKGNPVCNLDEEEIPMDMSPVMEEGNENFIHAKCPLRKIREISVVMGIGT